MQWLGATGTTPIPIWKHLISKLLRQTLELSMLVFGQPVPYCASVRDISFKTAAF
jgi:hypothetical protein